MKRLHFFIILFTIFANSIITKDIIFTDLDNVKKIGNDIQILECFQAKLNTIEAAIEADKLGKFKSYSEFSIKDKNSRFWVKGYLVNRHADAMFYPIIDGMFLNGKDLFYSVENDINAEIVPSKLRSPENKIAKLIILKGQKAIFYLKINNLRTFQKIDQLSIVNGEKFFWTKFLEFAIKFYSLGLTFSYFIMVLSFFIIYRSSYFIALMIYSIIALILEAFNIFLYLKINSISDFKLGFSWLTFLILSTISTVAFRQFMQKFFNMKYSFPNMNKIFLFLNYLYYLQFLLYVLSIFSKSQIDHFTNPSLMLINNIILIISAVYLIKYDKAALYFSISLITTLVPIFFVFLSNVTGRFIIDPLLQSLIASIPIMMNFVMFLFAAANRTGLFAMKNMVLEDVNNLLSNYNKSFEDAISYEKSAEEAIIKLLVGARPNVHYTNALLFLRKGDNLELSVSLKKGLKYEPGEVLKNDIFKLLQCVSQNEAAIFNEIKNNDIIRHCLTDADNINALIVHPIKLSNRNLGVLVLMSNYGGEYSKEKIIWIKDLTEKIAIMVHYFNSMKNLNSNECLIKMANNTRKFHREIAQSIKNSILGNEKLLKELKGYYNEKYNSSNDSEFAKYILDLEANSNSLLFKLKEIEVMTGDEPLVEFEISKIYNSLSKLSNLLKEKNIEFIRNSKLPEKLLLFGPENSIISVLEIVIKQRISALTGLPKHVKPSLTVSIGLEESGMISFKIRDNGKHIENKDRFFSSERDDVYAKLENSLAKQIVERLKGSIEIKSYPGEFNEFVFYLDLLKR